MKHLLNFSALPVGSQMIPKEGPYAYRECISLFLHGPTAPHFFSFMQHMQT